MVLRAALNHGDTDGCAEFGLAAQCAANTANQTDQVTPHRNGPRPRVHGGLGVMFQSASFEKAKKPDGGYRQ